MNYALSELEARHHRKELAIMKRMEQLELARRQLGLSWADLGESDNYLRCAEAGTIQPSITVSSLSPEQMQGMLNTKVLLWRLGTATPPTSPSSTRGWSALSPTTSPTGSWSAGGLAHTSGSGPSPSRCWRARSCSETSSS